jgi:hypothetical protein
MSLLRFCVEIAGLDDGWTDLGPDVDALADPHHPFTFAECPFKSTKSWAATCPPSPTPPQKSIACAYLRPMRSSPSLASGISLGAHPLIAVKFN